MTKKITIYGLNNNLNITKNNINNIVSIFPNDIINDITNIENYKNLDWSDFPQRNKLNKQFTFYNGKDKRDVNNGLAIRVGKISEFLQYMISLHEHNDNKFIFNIDAITIKNILGKDYEMILCLLHNLKIIERTGTYYNGTDSHCYAYIISKRLIYTAENYSIIFIEDPKKIDKLEKKTISENYNDEVVAITDKRMIDTLITTTLDKPSALTYSINDFFNSAQQKEHLNKLIYRINYILLFGVKKYLKSGEKSKRIYSHLTYMPKELRPFLNRKFFNVDLTNSQLLILCYYAKLNNLKIDNSFIDDCQNGVIYEQFMLLNDNDRKQSKVAVFSEILFDFKTAKNNLTNALFKKLYPQTWLTLKEINDSKKENGTLASKLQSMEFDIFSTTPSVCKNSHFLFTLHDCIYFNDADDKDLVIQHLTNKFAEMGLKVSFNFE
ncbi:hypothetical protein [Paenimyroides baculatum]|uniref:Uncharacterized protein n=1 Tax=Paenimyroides baculatum TaxID=2608000 RepID=A0A5M6CGL7_9FLAO|nr:hypothetical protein [Paenimyroides baculatum]KAA5534321.1 hypothetical protein F0460_09440 [Paenimyroides baculatum]